MAEINLSTRSCLEMEGREIRETSKGKIGEEIPILYPHDACLSSCGFCCTSAHNGRCRTQGKGKFQIELNGEFTYDKEIGLGGTTREAGGELSA
jgi:hypothetical protein